MRTHSLHLIRSSPRAALALLGFAIAGAALAAPAATKTVVTATASAGDEKDSAPKTEKQRRIVIETVEPTKAGERAGKKEVAWLGVATEEASESLAAQLGLESGEGLVVTYVAPDSPAAKAKLQKNDVLVEFEGQMLVHPAQFRKLVQMRKEGDAVKLALYRTGKKQELTVTLAKTTLSAGLFGDERVWLGDLGELRRQLSELPIGDKMRDEMQHLRDSLAQAGIDKDTVRIEVKRSMEEARKAFRDALREATNAGRNVGPVVRELQELVRRDVDVDKDASITVKSHRNEVKTIVKTDDTGTYVVVANPKKRLTAHDKEGKLVFDGEIETTDQQESVPKEVWEKVKPMLEQMKKDKTEPAEAEEDRDGT